MTASNEDRYEEILRRIQARKPAGNPTAHTPLAGALDSLNGMGFLDDMRRRRFATINIYGPTAMRGFMDGRHWAGAVAWYKPRGYHHYREVTLLGVWAVEAGEAIWVGLGCKVLTFDMPVFNPESYYRTIRKRFDLHYPDDGGPPHAIPPDEAGGWRWAALYDSARRLRLRDELEAALAGWAAEMRRT